ncbi:alpha/beta hydrolase [Nocardioides sp. GCM10027113]|uniref:alpha/beta hydrolase n=1 Tax=unclassified Nocardioides TaxID=2615069 RepID=UPI00360EF053
MTKASPLAPMSTPARPELTGGRRVGVLLSHGFTGSPASIRPWAEHLAAQGYAVEMPLLPGHGTTWQDCNRTTFDDWHGAVVRYFELLRSTCDAVVVAGLSMGGAQVLRLAADRPDEVAGVVVVNPFVVSRRKDFLALPVMKWAVPSFPGIINDINKPGEDEHGYSKVPLRALHSLVRAGRRLADDLPEVTSPLLAFHSTEDHVVDDASIQLIMARVSSRDLEEVALPNSYHVATLDHDAPKILEASTAFIERVTS